MITIGQEYRIDLDRPKAKYGCCKLANFRPLLQGRIVTVVKEIKGQEGWYITDLDDFQFNKHALEPLTS